MEPLPEDAAQSRRLEEVRARATEHSQELPWAPGVTAADVQLLIGGMLAQQQTLAQQYAALQRAQAEREILHQQYVELFEAAPVGYCILDAEGRILQLNRRAGELLGAAPGEPLVRYLAAQADYGYLTDFLGRVMVADVHLTADVELCRPDGRTFYAQLEGVRLPSTADPARCRLAFVDQTVSLRAVADLSASEQKFRSMFEDSADAAVLVRDMCFVDCNRAALTMLGASHQSQLLGQSVLMLSPELQPDGRRSVEHLRYNMAQARQLGSYRFEWFRYRLTGEEIWQEIVLTPLRMQAETVLYAVWRDITAQKRLQLRLQESEARLKTALEAADMGIGLWDCHAQSFSTNERGRSILGLPPAAGLDFSFATVLALVHPDDHDRVVAALRQAATGPNPLNLELRVVRPDGSVRHLIADGQRVPDADPDILRLSAVLRDVTEHRRLREEAASLQRRQEKAVLAAIMHTQEDERKRIAEALHNGLGQLLYATKLQLYSQPVDEAHRAAALDLLDEAIRTTRTLSFELTPNILEDFGLQTALRELCKRIPAPSLRVHLHVDELPAPRRRLLETAVYRIVQELLNNVIKHAQAREAVVCVELHGAALHVSVEDDGQGFDVSLLPQQHNGIGLAGIRNRVGLLAGQLQVRSVAGHGSTISLQIPLGPDGL